MANDTATIDALAPYQGSLEDPLTRSEYWGHRSEDLRVPYPRTGFWQPPVEKGPEYYSPYGEYYTPPPYDPSWNENPDVEVFGDPKAFIDAELAQLMPAHPGSRIPIPSDDAPFTDEMKARGYNSTPEYVSMLRGNLPPAQSSDEYLTAPYLGVLQGGPQTETQQAPWAGITSQRGNIYPQQPGEWNWDTGYSQAADPRLMAPSDFEYYRNMTDMLAASGRLNAEDLGYRSTVDATDALRRKQHAMSSDTFGLQAGVKAGLAKQVSPWSAIVKPGTWGFYQKGQEAIKSLLGKGGSPEMLESEISNAARALEAYEAGQEMDYTQPKVSFSDLVTEPIPQDFAVGDESMASTEWNPWVPLGEPGWRPDLPARTLGGPEVGREAPEQVMASNVAQALAAQTPMGAPGSARVTPQLQALAELAKTDPTIADRYVPGSQELQDITSQVDSFAFTPLGDVGWRPPAPSFTPSTPVVAQKGPTPYVETFESRPSRDDDDDEPQAKSRRPSQRAPTRVQRTAVQKAVAPKTKYTSPKLEGRHPTTTAPKVTVTRRRRGGKPKVRRVSKAPRRPGGR